MRPLQLRLRGISTAVLLGLLAAGCAGQVAPKASPKPSPSPTYPGLLGLAGETAGPLLLAAPYRVQGTLAPGAKRVDSSAIPSTAMAAVSALAAALGVPGPPISTPTGLGYNLGSTSGYQLTTNAPLTSFNFHPNTPTDEVGTTPTVAGAEQFAESFLSAHQVPAGGKVIPLPQLSFANGSDRTVYFQWSLDGLPVVNILGQPQEIAVDVATDQFQVTQLVGISGAVPYGSTSSPVVYPAMTPTEALQFLNQGTVKPGRYLLSSAGTPFPAPSPAPSGPTTVDAVTRAIVDSYGTAVPVYVFQVVDNPAVSDFVTCAVAPAGCVPLRFSSATPSPSPSG